MRTNTLDEKKGTCCHKCGHVHVKGTKCPTPYLKGERSCARRTDELQTMDHHSHDEHHQMHADVDETTEFCPECLMEYITERWEK